MSLSIVLSEVRENPSLLRSRHSQLVSFYETDYHTLLRLAVTNCDADEELDEEMPPPPQTTENPDILTDCARDETNDRLAIEVYTRSINICPTCRRYVERGERYIRCGEFVAARTDATSALKLNVDSARAYRLRSIAAWNMNDAAAAYKDMCDAQRIDYDETVDALHQQMMASVKKDQVNRPQPFAAMPSSMDFNSLLQNPQLMDMAQSMLKNPELMRSMMEGVGSMTNK